MPAKTRQSQIKNINITKCQIAEWRKLGAKHQRNPTKNDTTRQVQKLTRHKNVIFYHRIIKKNYVLRFYYF